MDSKISSRTPSTDNAPSNRRFWWAIIFVVVLIGILVSRFFSHAQLSQTSNGTPDDPEQPPKAARAFLTGHLLVGVLVFSALVALADACRARWSLNMGIPETSPSKVSTEAPKPTGLFPRRPPPLTRRCSLVDLTVSRHERREMAANHHHYHHHHQPVSLPESCDPPSAAMFSGTFRCARRRPPPLSRHSSLSIRGSDDAILSSSSAAMAAALRRSSTELSDGEASPDSRRRCSRLLRRH